MRRTFLILLLATLPLLGCAQFAPRGESWTPIPSTLKDAGPDPKADPPPTSGSHNDLESWAVRWGKKYQQLRERHLELVKAVNRREEEK